MHHPLAHRIASLTESATIKMATMSRELKASGKNVIDLSLGEPDFGTPQHIRDAAKTAIDEGYSHYTPVPGYLSLRQAISAKFKNENNLDYSPDEIVVSTGAKQSIANLVLCLVEAGDEVIVPAPYWVSYAAIVQLAEGTQITIPSTIETNFKITPEQLEEAITPKTKLFMFSSPCNPSGSVYTREELAALAEVFERHPHVYIMSDEIYEHINFIGEHVSIGEFSEIKDRVITVNGFSKSFAMTGWRVGYMGAPKWIAQACNKMQGQFTSGTCSIAQKAAEAAISSDLGPTFKMKEAFNKRRDLVLELLEEINGLKVNKPDGAFYVFPDVSSFFGATFEDETIANADEMSLYLLKHALVATVSGAPFGNEDCIRFSYATSEENLKTAISRIAEALSKLKVQVKQTI